MNLLDLVKSQFGKYVMSIMLGLGLATIFRRTCKDRKCLVFVPPEMDSLSKDIYEYNGKCFKYEAKGIACDKTRTTVH